MSLTCEGFPSLMFAPPGEGCLLVQGTGAGERRPPRAAGAVRPQPTMEAGLFYPSGFHQDSEVSRSHPAALTHSLTHSLHIDLLAHCTSIDSREKTIKAVSGIVSAVARSSENRGVAPALALSYRAASTAPRL